MCHSPCVVEGETFQLDCLRTYHLTARQAPQKLKIRGEYNFTSILKAPELFDAFPKLQDPAVDEIPDIDMEILSRAKHLNDQPWLSLKRPHNITYVIILLLLISLGVLLGGGYAYYKCGAKCGPKCLRDRARKAALATANQAVPMVHYAPQRHVIEVGAAEEADPLEVTE